MANKNETAKKVVGGVALGLVLVLAGGVCGGLLQRHFNWGEDPAVETPAGETANGGAIIGESQGSGIKLTGAVIAKADYAANEVSPLAETAYTITVTPTPADAHDTYSWTTTDDVAIKLTPSNGGKTCLVECLSAFGTQVTLTCTSESNPDVTASVTVDYVKRISSVTVSVNPTSVKFGSTEASHTITATPVWGTGTIQPTNFAVSGGTLTNNIMESTFQVKGLRNSYRTGYFVPYEFSGLTFSAASPYDLFLDHQVATNGANNTPAPPESTLETAYNNEFISKAAEETGDGTLTIKYSYSYGDIVTVTDATASIDVEFDVSGLVVSATEITLSEDSLIF